MQIYAKKTSSVIGLWITSRPAQYTCFFIPSQSLVSRMAFVPSLYPLIFNIKLLYERRKPTHVQNRQISGEICCTLYWKKAPVAVFLYKLVIPFFSFHLYWISQSRVDTELRIDQLHVVSPYCSCTPRPSTRSTLGPYYTLPCWGGLKKIKDGPVNSGSGMEDIAFSALGNSCISTPTLPLTIQPLPCQGITYIYI